MLMCSFVFSITESLSWGVSQMGVSGLVDFVVSVDCSVVRACLMTKEFEECLWRACWMLALPH